MRILVSGSTGFLGAAVVETLERGGHQVVRLVRPQTDRKKTQRNAIPIHASTQAATAQASTPQASTHQTSTAQASTAQWDPVANHFEAAAAERADALVHLAGASIAEGRWTPARKALLRASRVDATRHLFGALSRLQHPPPLIVASSAIGYYGDRGDEALSETSASGSGFLPTICREWEDALASGREFAARVAQLRFGIILGTQGGALPRMALPFKLGAGGQLGSGRQWMSWLTLREAVNIVSFALATSTVAGPVNAVTPNPVRNADFTRILAGALHRPAFIPTPSFALRLALGEMADALLLASQRVTPAKLEQAGYQFVQLDLTSALAELFRTDA